MSREFIFGLLQNFIDTYYIHLIITTENFYYLGVYFLSDIHSILPLFVGTSLVVDTVSAFITSRKQVNKYCTE